MGALNAATAAIWTAGRWVGERFRPRAAITSAEGLEEVFRLLNSGGPTASGVSVTVDRAMQQAAVHACVRVIGESLAHLPLVLYRRGEKRKDPARDLPLFTLLHDRPNEWQTSFEWRELMQSHLSLRGNAYSLKVMGIGGRIQELIPLNPDVTRPKQDRDTLVITYEYTRPNGSRIELPRDQVLHIRGLGNDGVAGMSPIRWHRETIGDALATQEHGARFFSNGAKPLGVLELLEGGKIGDEAQKSLRADFESMYAGGANAHKTAILPGGITYKPITVSNEDAQFLETREFQRTEIASIFRVPPHMIGDLKRATFSNIEQQSLEFVIYTLAPWMVRWEQALARDLLGNDPTLFVKHNVNALLRGTAKDRAEALQVQRRNGIINANEWREIEDLNPRTDDGGDEYIVERNMGPQSAEETPEPPPNPEPNDDA